MFAYLNAFARAPLIGALALTGLAGAAPASAVDVNVNVAVHAAGQSICISSSLQRNVNNNALIDQDCDRNHAGVNQIGHVNNGAIIQRGHDNNARIRQRGLRR